MELRTSTAQLSLRTRYQITIRCRTHKFNRAGNSPARRKRLPIQFDTNSGCSTPVKHWTSLPIGCFNLLLGLRFADWPGATWDNGGDLDTAFEHGIELINAGSYYAAHDALEEVWRRVHGWTKPFYQGMTQVAISLHHFSTGNMAGAQSVMAKSRKNLAEFPGVFCGVDVEDLMAQLDAWEKALAEGGPYPAKVVVRVVTER